MIVLKNISKTFYRTKEPFRALDDINLEVKRGDIVGIIGESGAGKSTLIRCVNLLEKPDGGQIIVNGKDLTQLDASQLAGERKKIGMIFQHFNLLSSRTVFDNVALPLELDHVGKAEIKRKVNELLKIVGLEDKAQDYPKNLSGGQKQRVAIARALANDPYLLLSDEATSALDPATTQSILQLLRDINQRLNITILLITHEMEVVKSVCNYVAVIDKGRLVTQGTLSEILKKNEHPVARQYLNAETLSIPPELNGRLHAEYKAGLFPLIEVQLSANIQFDELVAIVSQRFKVPYKLLKADVEYIGDSNYGHILLLLHGTPAENGQIIQHFNENNIQNHIKAYV